MSTKILCVDDDANILAAYQRTLRKQFSIDTAISGQQGLSILKAHGPYAVVVADMQMPGMNGIEFLLEVQETAPETVRMMLTGNADQLTAMEAINKGQVHQFLNKPCPPETLALALEGGIKQYRLITAERELLEKTLSGSIKLLTEILSMVEPQSFGRGQKLREYMRAFLQSDNLRQSWELEAAAMLSQIGYVTIPPGVTERARAGHGLLGSEKDMLARVPGAGADLLFNIPRLESIARIVPYQSKNYDGSGFPADAVSGENIPIGSRILKVLSDLLQLESHGISKTAALDQMQKRSGSYDPRVLDATFACFDIYLEKSTSTGPAGRSLPFRDLRPGQVLSKDIRTKEGTRIITAGNRISPMLLQRLRNFEKVSGIEEPIYIEA